jgi:peptidyl-prolyl cis-trans isomerase A (cyclophilin A)
VAAAGLGDRAMKGVTLGALALVVLLVRGAAGQGLPRVRFETGAGSFTAEIDTVRAPITGRNFLRYVDAGLYRGGVFHRTVRLDNQPDNPVKIEVVQAAADTVRGSEYFGPIPLERTSTTGLRHGAGTLSMARTTPDTAEDQFFVCVTAQPELDAGGKRNPDGQGFAAFGRIVTGIDVVRKIHRSPASGQRLTPLILITDARRVR